MPTLKYRFGIGVRVGQVVTTDYRQGVVLGFAVNGGGDVMYTIRWDDGDDSDHYEFELESYNERRSGKEDWRESLEEETES